MLKYIIKRLGLSILILVGVSVIIYVLVRIQPGLDFVERKYSFQLSIDDTGEVRKKVDEIKATYGLDVSPIQGYFKWLSNVVQGDLGDSFIFSVPTGEIETIIDPNGVESKKPINSSSVVQVIKKKCGISFIISLVATILEFVIAIPLGILSATKQYGILDYTVTVLAMMGISLPSFFFGAVLLKIFSVDLGWFPYAGLTDPNSGLPTWIDIIYHLVLPMTVLVILSIGGLMRYTRTNMLEVLNADYIRTARAKGLSEHTVIYKHAFRNTLIPLVTTFAGILPGLFGGAMITETVFSIDGIGKAAYLAVTQRDIPFVMAYNMFLSILTVIGTLLADLMYAVVDPRVKLA
ncbi:MAG: ABC transporter permease [Bacilli bacterium]|nr:ABC transporter permease [Bacilli bacterium]